MILLSVRAKRIMLSVTSFCLVFIALFLSILFVAMDRGFYRDQFRKLDRAEATGMSEEDLMNAAEALIRYIIHPDVSTIEARAVIDGEERDVFVENELLHMVDVKWLFTAMIYVLRVFAAVAATLPTLCFLYTKDRWETARIFGKRLIIVTLAITAAMLILVVIFSMNFSSAFNTFHEIFFTNDLWQLDPANSIMINMVPLEFFIACAIRLSIYFGIFIATYIAVGIALLKWKRKVA